MVASRRRRSPRWHRAGQLTIACGHAPARTDTPSCQSVMSSGTEPIRAIRDVQRVPRQGEPCGSPPMSRVRVARVQIDDRDRRPARAIPRRNRPAAPSRAGRIENAPRAGPDQRVGTTRHGRESRPRARRSRRGETTPPRRAQAPRGREGNGDRCSSCASFRYVRAAPRREEGGGAHQADAARSGRSREWAS